MARLRFADLAAAYRSGRDTPVDVAERALDGAGQPVADHVFIALTTARARREAEASRQRWRDGAPLGLLDGMPVVVKDLVDLAGEITTAGSELRRHATAASSDATVAARLSAAGAVIIGKTNLSEFAFSGLGVNPHYGTPTNAVQADLIPGGSSSGTGVAIALGLAAGGVGTDTSGSIRIPAAYNRIAGYRPSRSRISQTGVFPLAPNLDSVGPMATCVADLAALDAVFRGSGDIVAPGTRRRLCAPSGILLSELDPAIEAAFEATFELLAKQGWEIDRRPIPSLDQVSRLLADQGSLATWEAAGVHRHLLDSPDLDRLDPLVGTRLKSGAAMPLDRVETLKTIRTQLIRQLTDELSGDLLLCPSVCALPPSLADCSGPLERTMALNMRGLRNTMVLSFVDAPGVSLPMGAADLPAGVLLSGAALDDEAVLAAAFALEAALA